MPYIYFIIFCFFKIYLPYLSDSDIGAEILLFFLLPRPNFYTIFFFKCLVVVQLLSGVRLFATQWTAARQTSLSFTISWSLLKLMSIKSVMPSNHLILCHSLILLSSIFPSIGVFSNESALCIRWPKYWSFNSSPSNGVPKFIYHFSTTQHF